MQDGSGLLVEQFLVAPPARLDLPGRDQHRGALREPGVVVDVVGAERLLDPVRVVLLPQRHRPQRCGQVVPRVVGVERHEHARADGFADRRQPLLVSVGVEPSDLHLHRAEPGVDVAAHLLGEVLRPLALEVVPAAGVCGH